MFGRLTPVVRNLLIINVVILAFEQILKIDLSHWFGLRYVLADSFKPYQFVTYMFLHGGWFHLISNMFALFIFGPLLEQFWGPKRFLIFYMITGVGAGILWSTIDYIEKRPIENTVMEFRKDPTPETYSDFLAKNSDLRNYGGQIGAFMSQAYQIEDSFYKSPDNQELKSEATNVVDQIYYLITNIPMIGASGAIFGILMAFGLLFPNTTLMLLFPPIPIKAKYFVAIYGFFELFSGIRQTPGDNVAHFAHIGGMIFAFILIKIWQKQRNKFY